MTSRQIRRFLQQAVKPCAFGAPLTRLWGLTARHGQTRGIRALMEISMPIADLAGGMRDGSAVAAVASVLIGKFVRSCHSDLLGA